MKILFVGLGSVGQRHLQNILTLRPKIEKIVGEKIELYSFYSGTARRSVIKNGKVKKVKDFDAYYRIKTLPSLATAMKTSPEVVFITNPSSLHVKTALLFAGLGSNLFIEKPLGTEHKGLDKLTDVIRKKRLVTMVGYQTRFNPVVGWVKDYVNKNFGKLNNASFVWHTYLPSHHTYENYSQGYAARKDLGGGVIMGLIHEVDLIYHLLGLPSNITAAGGKFSDLSIDVEDTAKMLMKYRKNQKHFIVSLSLSYSQTHEVRGFVLQFNDATVSVDLIANKATLHSSKGKTIKVIKTKMERNDLFQEEVLHFFRCLSENSNTGIDVEEGIKSTKLALEFKKSITLQQWKKIQ
ncbi:MAG TPA: Gfo/Idh/MocA family oxidoreductase [Patescibacteria group bacterium]|nr:Gfo/Idh/MocA family oxidoreductase [Patescibacteria group bacterium]